MSNEETSFVHANGTSTSADQQALMKRKRMAAQEAPVTPTTAEPTQKRKHADQDQGGTDQNDNNNNMQQLRTVESEPELKKSCSYWFDFQALLMTPAPAKREPQLVHGRSMEIPSYRRV